MIGPEGKVTGRLDGLVDLRICGKVRGEIFARTVVVEPTGHAHTTLKAYQVNIRGWLAGQIEAPRVVIEKSATVRAVVRAYSVEVQGRVTGRVEGFEVRVSKTARINGDVVHCKLEVEEGAVIRGLRPPRPAADPRWNIDPVTWRLRKSPLMKLHEPLKVPKKKEENTAGRIIPI